MPVKECVQYDSEIKILLNKCSLCIHIKVVFSNSQKPYVLAYDIFPLCNRIKCRSEICENIGGIVLFCKWGNH